VNKEARGCSDRIATQNQTKDTFKWRKIDTTRHKNTKMEQNKLSPAFSRTTEQARTRSNPNERTSTLRRSIFSKMKTCRNSKTENLCLEKHKKLALAVENLKILLDLDTGRF